MAERGRERERLEKSILQDSSTLGSMDLYALCEWSEWARQWGLGGGEWRVVGTWRGEAHQRDEGREREGDSQGNRCSVLLGRTRTEEGDSERIPHFSSTILQQCSDLSTTMTTMAAPYFKPPCNWSSDGNSIRSTTKQSSNFVLSSHQCLCSPFFPFFDRNSQINCLIKVLQIMATNILTTFVTLEISKD